MFCAHYMRRINDDKALFYIKFVSLILKTHRLYYLINTHLSIIDICIVVEINICNFARTLK